MVTTRLYLDARYSYATGADCPIKIQITKRGRTALLSTGIRVLPDQWDKANLRIVRHPQKVNLNLYLTKLKIRVDEIVRELILSGRAADMTVVEIKDRVAAEFLGTSQSVTLGEFAGTFLKTKSTATAGVYTSSLRVVYKFDPKAETRPISEFGEAWAERVAAWLTENYAGNTRKTIASNLSAIFNKAVAEKLIQDNPFSKVKFSYVQTRKRNLTQAQFRRFWSLHGSTEAEEIAMDLFRFSFLTIAANPVDIAQLSPRDIFNGRIEYDRSKTGRHYSIKIVPELEPLLKRYADAARLFPPLGGYAGYRTILSNADKRLALISTRAGLPRITMYWVRHSWASFAAALDIPIDVISNALGHSHGARVTMVYINVDTKKVDDAARRVIDYALYDPLD